MNFLILMTDGSSMGNPGPASIGWVLWNRNSDQPIARGGRSIGKGTSNAAEWLALVEGLRQAKALGAQRVVAYTDSELVARQFCGEYRVKSAALASFYRDARGLAQEIGRVSVVFVHRQILHLADREAQKQHDITSKTPWPEERTDG